MREFGDRPGYMTMIWYNRWNPSNYEINVSGLSYSCKMRHPFSRRSILLATMGQTAIYFKCRLPGLAFQSPAFPYRQAVVGVRAADNVRLEAFRTWLESRYSAKTWSAVPHAMDGMRPFAAPQDDGAFFMSEGRQSQTGSYVFEWYSDNCQTIVTQKNWGFLFFPETFFTSGVFSVFFTKYLIIRILNIKHPIFYNPFKTPYQTLFSSNARAQQVLVLG